MFRLRPGTGLGRQINISHRSLGRSSASGTQKQLRHQQPASVPLLLHLPKQNLTPKGRRRSELASTDCGVHRSSFSLGQHSSMPTTLDAQTRMLRDIACGTATLQPRECSYVPPQSKLDMTEFRRLPIFLASMFEPEL